MTFDVAYENDPWTRLTENQRDWYVPALLQHWRNRSLWAPLVPMQGAYDLNSVKTNRMVFNLVFDLEPNIDPIGLRDLWLNAMETDSAQIEITTEHHGGKIQMHKYDDMVTYWTEQSGQGNSQGGLLPIIRNRLAPAITEHLDKLARNAHLKGTFQTFGAGGVAETNFSHIATTELFNLEWALDAQLRAQTLSLPGFDGIQGSGNILCVTTPGATYEVQQSVAWRERNQYTTEGLAVLNKYEVGSYKGTRFLTTPQNILHNSGAITKQCTITAAASAGAGGANWGTYTVGQDAATKYLQLSIFAAGDFKVNDIVTIHVARMDAAGVVQAGGGGYSTGVVNGVDPFDGMTFNRVVKSVDATTYRLGFDRPIFWDLTTDLGAGVYGYVTKGIDVHATVFIYMPGGVVAGSTQAPTIHIPPTIDDTMSMRRFSWDAYIKYQQFRPELFEVFFHAGKKRVHGAANTGA